jgi:hypothetical protein
MVLALPEWSVATSCGGHFFFLPFFLPPYPLPFGIDWLLYRDISP